MSSNLLIITAFGFGAVGALVTLVSQLALWRTRRALVAYPRVLARLRAQRLDRRFGLLLLALGGVVHALARLGYSAPLSLWRYPAAAAAVLALTYCVIRLVVRYRRVSRGGSLSVRSIYETPRTRTLREAAVAEAAALRAQEAARDPRDTGIVFLAREWDQRWWSSRFGVSVGAIQAAIRQVGPMVKDVERHLGVERVAA